MAVLIRFKNAAGGVDHYHRIHQNGSIDATPDTLMAARFVDEGAARACITASRYLSSLDPSDITFEPYEVAR